MNNKNNWKPNKFVFINGKLTASRKHVGKGSLLVADLVAEKYQTYIPKFAKGKLLDLGCGFVPFYELYKEYVEDNICVDWENSLHKNDFLDIKTDINNPLPFESQAFDSILVSDVLEHIYKPYEIFSEMKRLLKPNGVIILNTPFAYWEHEAPFDYFRYTKFFYEKIATEIGFEIEVLEPLGDGLACISDILSKIAANHDKFIWLAKLVDRYVRKNLNNEKKLLPNLTLGYFVVLRNKQAR